MKLTSENIYLGRTHHLFSMKDLYKVAASICDERRTPEEEAFTALNVRTLAAASSIPVLGVVWTWNEHNDTHYTNVNGIVLMMNLVPPTLRAKYFEAISAVLLITDELTSSQRMAAVEAIKIDPAKPLRMSIGQKLIERAENIDDLPSIVREELAASLSEEEIKERALKANSGDPDFIAMPDAGEEEGNA